MSNYIEFKKILQDELSSLDKDVSCLNGKIIMQQQQISSMGRKAEEHRSLASKMKEELEGIHGSQSRQ